MEEPGEVEGGDAAAFVDLFVLAVFVLEIEFAFAGSAWSTCGEGGVGSGTGVDEAFDRPGFSGVEAAPDGELLAFVTIMVSIAVEEDVMPFDREPNETGVHAEVSVVVGTFTFLSSVGWTIGESLEERWVLPGFASVLAEGVMPLVAEFLTLGEETAAGGVKELTVGEVEQIAFSAALNGDGLAGNPGFASVITVDRCAVAFGGVSLDSSWSNESPGMFAIAKGNAVFGHVE